MFLAGDYDPYLQVYDIYFYDVLGVFSHILNVSWDKKYMLESINLYIFRYKMEEFSGLHCNILFLDM